MPEKSVRIRIHGKTSSPSVQDTKGHIEEKYQGMMQPAMVLIHYSICKKNIYVIHKHFFYIFSSSQIHPKVRNQPDKHVTNQKSENLWRPSGSRGDLKGPTHDLSILTAIWTRRRGIEAQAGPSRAIGINYK